MRDWWRRWREAAAPEPDLELDPEPPRGQVGFWEPTLTDEQLDHMRRQAWLN